MGLSGSVTLLAGADPLPAGLPIGVQVEFTSRCNLRCRMCPLTTGTSSSSASPGPMHDVVFDEVLRIARRCRHVVLAGYGEPLKNPQCLPMLRALDAEQISVGMATNGLLVTPDIARQLVAIEHLRLINVSIDSPDPDVYRAVRGGDVRHALRGLRNLMAAIDDPQRVIVSSVGMATTLATLVDFPALLAEIGVRRFSLQGVADYNDYAREQRLLDHEHLADALRAIEANCAAFGIELELFAPDRSHADLEDAPGARARFYGADEWDERLTRQCNVPWDIPFVDKDGAVFPCCFAAAADESRLGQLGPQTFDAVWTGVAFRRFRADIVDGRTTPAICRRCTLAPLGRHVFKTWAATIVAGTIDVPDTATATVSLSVLNQSERSWRASDHVHVGTAAPRDSPSPLMHSRWLSRNRPATFTESAVPPGAIATFEFPVAVPRGAVNAEFELVADGTCWLPNTRFAVSVRGRHRTPGAIVLPAAKRRLRVLQGR